MNSLITSSLIDGFYWLKSCPPSWKEQAYVDFVNTVQRISAPTTPECQRGIDFENLICKNCNEKTDEEMSEIAREYFGSIATKHGIIYQNDRKFVLDNVANTVKEVAYRCRGGKQQEKLTGTIVVDDTEYTLFGYADIVQSDRIIDIKTCTQFRSPKKYTDRTQHLIYSYILNMRCFEYVVADYKKTKYPLEFHSIVIPNLDNSLFKKELKSRIREVIEFIKQENLYDDYLNEFSAKSRCFQ